MAEHDVPWEAGKGPFRMKGIAYRSLLKFIEEEVPGGIPDFLALCSEPLREFSKQPFMAASWYDNAPVVPMSAIVARKLGLTLADFLDQRGGMHAREDLSGVYGWLLRLATPATVAKRLPRLMSRYFDWGTVEVREVSGSRALIQHHETPIFLADWFRRVSTPYLEVALHLAGAKDVTVDHSRHDGGRVRGVPAARLDFVLQWRDHP